MQVCSEILSVRGGNMELLESGRRSKMTGVNHRSSPRSRLYKIRKYPARGKVVRISRGVVRVTGSQMRNRISKRIEYVVTIAARKSLHRSSVASFFPLFFLRREAFCEQGIASLRFRTMLNNNSSGSQNKKARDRKAKLAEGWGNEHAGRKIGKCIPASRGEPGNTKERTNERTKAVPGEKRNRGGEANS